MGHRQTGPTRPAVSRNRDRQHGHTNVYFPGRVTPQSTNFLPTPVLQAVVWAKATTTTQSLPQRLEAGASPSPATLPRLVRLRAEPASLWRWVDGWTGVPECDS